MTQPLLTWHYATYRHLPTGSEFSFYDLSSFGLGMRLDMRSKLWSTPASLGHDCDGDSTASLASVRIPSAARDATSAVLTQLSSD